jgi:hypothetical protein
MPLRTSAIMVLAVCEAAFLEGVIADLTGIDTESLPMRGDAARDD